jgi:hypothetical protein
MPRQKLMVATMPKNSRNFPTSRQNEVRKTLEVV